ncbi:PREDICTED: pyridoxal-dependent decarboxylase domain-containing protein 1 [Nicrophorus vespilloides]|uniref:Pyridoxal-dependent decarboxylase domain-containing protein 1 n=1 Tax=Nicrophorus vespilloides TaxID=110193 RepID=A0ABM1N5J7_NICVS|nr:PREDICTED: pyridoxal-dependent decarboxylase domain-containing protein 1 [Nicrophorus vespilloides]
MATTPQDKNIAKIETAISMEGLTKTTLPANTNRNFGEIAIEASQIVSRLEKVAEGGPTPPEQGSTVFLGLLRREPDDILQTIQGLINVEEDGPPPGLDPVGKLVISCHSLAAYCGALDRHTLQKLSTRFTTDTTRWLSQMFGFLDCAAFYHDDQLEGLVRVTRMMLHYKYPRYLEDGALAYSASPPTIYSSMASPLGVVQHLCRQLGLPLSCVRPVPVNTHFGSQYTMDVAALQKMIAEDISAGRSPLLVVADAGTPITGHLDNMSRLQELCKENNIWLHLRGHSLAALALPLQPHSAQPSPIADSFTLPLGGWLGLLGLPMVTLYRLWDKSSANSEGRQRQLGASRESTLPLVAGLTNDHMGRRILALPLWAAMQALGREGIHARIRDNFLSSERLWAAVDCYRQVRVLSQKPGGESGAYTVSELISKPIKIALLFETTACSVVFQFVPELSEGETLGRIPPYFDKLNSWLGQILQLDAPQVPIDICELENCGVVLRFCPFESAVGPGPSLNDIESFVQCLEQQLIILRATIQHKETFVKLIDASPVLRIVELPEWAGLGGVRYAPEGWEELLTDQAKEELNNLNMALVDSLRSTDSAFSLGEGTDGLMCVRFGMLTPQSDVEELISLVIRVGQSVEENSRVLDSMSEILKKGIETATLDLQKENEERLWQEGILRQVPVFGSLVNWWSPKTKETGVRGRSLNLTQGVVESTENIYKYHMQMQGRNVQSGVKSPPTPQVQTPVGGSHSRSSSHASSQGAPSIGQLQTQLTSVKIDKETTPENGNATT